MNVLIVEFFLLLRYPLVQVTEGFPDTPAAKATAEPSITTLNRSQL